MKTRHRDTNGGGLIAGPLTAPPKAVAVAPAPEFIRLPPVGYRCPFTGMTRAGLNGLILPTPENGNRPPVRSFCLRQRGAKKGIRLIDYASLASHIRAHEDFAEASDATDPDPATPEVA